MNATRSRYLKALTLSSLLFLLILAACTNQPDNPQNPNNEVNMQSAPNHTEEAHHLQDPRLIPSYHGTKTETTNEHGNTTGEMGMTVYSLIGSSSLHEGGVSSHVQSRLASQGIEGIKAFVINDTIILARAEPLMSSNQYDRMQREVLSQTDGMSGKGDPDGLEEGEAGEGDNMAQAKEEVQRMFNKHVHILSVTNPEAPELIDRIAAKLHDSPQDASIAVDINELLQMASNDK